MHRFAEVYPKGEKEGGRQRGLEEKRTKGQRAGDGATEEGGGRGKKWERVGRNVKEGEREEKEGER